MEELIEKAGILRRQQELLSKFKKRYIYLIGTEQDILTKLIYAFHENKDYQEFTYNKWSKRQYIFNNGGEVHYSTFLLNLNEPLENAKKKADGFIFVYNNRDRLSFERAFGNIDKLLTQLKAQLNEATKDQREQKELKVLGKIVLLGYDDNSEKKIVIPPSRGMEIADSYNMFFYEISSSTLGNITNIVENMVYFFNYYVKKNK